MKRTRAHLLMCFGTSCLAGGVQLVKEAILRELEKRDLLDEVNIVETGCNGFCANGPIMVMYPGGYFYQKLKPEDAPELVEEHILKGRPVKRLMYIDAKTEKVIPYLHDIPFFGKQKTRVLRNKGLIAAENIDEYIAREGYEAAYKAVKEITPQGIVDEVKKSGLRGRGGGGFPTGLKWEFAARESADQKYVLCNADEGDPGAFMDRSILEADPHAVVEGMIIAARAVGASRGYVYCRAEYPLALERLGKAINVCREYGLLGDNIFDSDFSFDIEISKGAGAFVCGEETALMASIEGKRGEPRPRPPFPAQKGLWDRPTVLNNVETYASVPLIIRNGADWYTEVGTEKSKGTKIFALTGAVNNVGLVEVPMGTMLGEIVYDIGGGIRDGRPFKAAQIGGPSGGCIPRMHLNLPLDYESVEELGAIMGSGGLIIMDDNTCMVDLARFFLEFVQDESCGKCPPCRIGTKRMLEILERITQGKGEEGDIEKLEKLAYQIKETALCGLGQTAPNPVLSTIRHFREEYEEHIRYKYCRAGVCADLVRAPCQNECPAGVDVPGYVSLISEGRYREALELHRERNPFPSICARVCMHTCETKCRRTQLDSPVSIRALKRFLADTETEFFSTPVVMEDENRARHKVAIIGAGPSGLSCAYFLARIGYKPTVFESRPEPGGMLRYGIPEYRLPKKVLDQEIRLIRNLGVEMKTNTSLGKDFTIEGLREEGFDAVYLAIGAWGSMRLGIEGEDARGVYGAVDFLEKTNTGEDLARLGDVVVIGGGHAAIDSARTALRLDSDSVTLIYRRTRDEMPVSPEELDEAEREGIRVKYLVTPVKFLTEDGRLRAVTCRNMSLGEFDRSGRRRPVPVEESAFDLPVDTAIVAIGQQTDEDAFRGDGVLQLNRNKTVQIDRDSRATNLPYVFAGGDIVRGPSSVVHAIADGQETAVCIDRYIMQEPDFKYPWTGEKVLDTKFDPDADPVETPRVGTPTIALSDRRRNFHEVEIALTEKQARLEAERCLRCDYREEK